jgi:sugar phosphate isomerase/epimerase
MYKLKLGKSVPIRDQNFYEIITEMKAVGFDSADMDFCQGGYIYSEEDGAEVEKRLEALKDSGLFFNGVHIPYGKRGSDISDTDEENRLYSIACIKKLISFVDRYNPKCYILHGSWEPIMDSERAAHMENMIRSINELQSFTDTPIALENLPRTCMLNTVAEVLEAAKKRTKPYFCIDVNHFLRDIPHEAVAAIAKYAITTHISDYDLVFEQHWLPTENKYARIDWNKLIGALENAEYNGVFNYEVKEACYRDLRHMKENYEMLFAAYNAQK